MPPDSKFALRVGTRGRPIPSPCAGTSAGVFGFWNFTNIPGRAREPWRDRVKILEDTDADGVADKVTVFAEGFNLATGLLVGNGGVYVGEAPESLVPPGHQRG